ncbi:MAG: 16S rRNA (adenine(1518)-N(6)/adenine(1519)-N(6))-dimethyltransferase RsmA [Hyphomicrobiales bacterium]|nr:16S rRNA (adenine(1518)-N(6)/adenine(1519)-N(6))-dimethyltransferase RsmA [Hyphomicrobiales bacterium]
MRAHSEPKASLAGLPPLREVVRAHGLMARKSLGQNYLFDLNLTRKIARSSGSLHGVTVVEIGPGPGGLTRALLEEGAEKVVAIEADRRFIPALQEIAACAAGRLTVIEADALALDLPKDLGSPLSMGPVRVIANLPYNIATPLLIGWLKAEPWPPWWQVLAVMVQREVALRIVATPQERAAYGRLAVLAGWRSEARLLFDVPPSAFTPAPKVTSSLVRLDPRPVPLACSAAALERVTAAAFGQRRKMLRQSLKTLGVDPLPLVEAAGVAPTSRAEELPVQAFVAMANALTRSEKA